MSSLVQAHASRANTLRILQEEEEMNGSTIEGSAR